MKPLDLLVEQLDGLNIPILAEFDTCHTHPMHPLAIGKKVQLDAGRKKFFVLKIGFNIVGSFEKSKIQNALSQGGNDPLYW